jgi:hypothetical protein
MPEKFLSSTKFLNILSIFFLGIGLLTFQDYGASYDEPGLFSYAEETIQAYQGVFLGIYSQSYADPIQRHYGPFLFVVFSLFGKAFSFTGLPESDLWHLAYLFTFLIGIRIYYLLSRRWLSEWSSLAVVMIFSSQPLIWGHVFMNPKDTPFMFFFALTLLLGLKMVDHFAALPVIPMERLYCRFFNKKTIACPLGAAIPIKANLIAGTSVLFVVWAFTSIWKNLVEKLVSFFYFSESSSLANTIFLFFLDGETNIPASQYVSKASIWLTWLQVSISVVVFIFIAASILLYMRHNPLALLTQSLQSPFLIFAAFLLGVAVSLRLTAGLIGAFIVVMMFWKIRERAIVFSFSYGILSLIFMYLLWPILWVKPLPNFMRSIQVMSEFARQETWFDYPYFLFIQWTEPIIFLLIIGCISFLIKKKRLEIKIEYALVFSITTLLPFILLMVSRSYMYDNFRQMMFLWLLMFTMIGFAFEFFFKFVHRWFLRITLILLVCLFGWIPSFQLHPYQYAYYNNFIGGLPGAAQQGYLTDYWGISFREAAHFLNDNAADYANIAVCGPAESLINDLRPDINAKYFCKNVHDGYFDYAVLNSRGRYHELLFQDKPIVYKIQRSGVVFTVIKVLDLTNTE